jgi:hypothetical protein
LRLCLQQLRRRVDERAAQAFAHAVAEFGVQPRVGEMEFARRLLPGVGDLLAR